MSAAHDTQPTGNADDPRDPPDYLLRRALFVGLVVAAIAGAAILVGRVVGSDDDASSALATTGEWNTVVVLTEDAVQLTDPSSGDVLETFESSEDLLDAISETSGQTLVLLGPDGQITQLDLADGTARRARSAADGVLRVSAGNRGVMSAGVEAGGELTILDTRPRTSIAVGTAAGLDDPLMFTDELFVNASGTHAAVSDGRTFQTVLVDLAEESAELLGGQVAALNDSTIVTVQRAGDKAELDFYDLSAERIGTVDVPSPEAVLLTGERSALAVSGDGRIVEISSTGRTNEVGLLADSSGSALDVQRGAPAFGDKRLVVEASGTVFVLDENGDIVTSVAGTVAGPITATTRCVMVGDGSSTGRSVQIDVESGEELGALTGGIVAASSFDGCTVAMIGGPSPQVLASGELIPVEFRGGSPTGVSPDGSRVVASSRAGERLIDLTDQSGVTLSRETAVIRFADVP